MVQPMIGDAAVQEIQTFRNGDTVTILRGAPVFLKGLASKTEIISGVSANAAAFVGIAATDIAVGEAGAVVTGGWVDSVRFPAVTTGALWASILPTVGSAGVYSFTVGAATAASPNIVLTEALVAGAAENGRGKAFIKRC